MRKIDVRSSRDHKSTYSFELLLIWVGNIIDMGEIFPLATQVNGKKKKEKKKESGLRF